MNTPHTHQKKILQRGYTLVELLLYIAMVGVILTAAVTYFGLVIDARVKNDTIAQVNDAGTALMDYYTRTIRNATSINSPTTGATATSLSLAVPNGTLNPTVFNTNTTTLGYTSDGGTTSTAAANTITACKFTASATGTVTTLSALVDTVDASTHNMGQMAIYSGASSPTTLLASSADTTLTPGSWNSFDIPTVTLTSGQTYWLAYDTNATTSALNDLRYHAGTAGQSRTVAQTYGTWPSSWSGTTGSNEFSLYAFISPTGTVGTPRVTEGAGGAVDLINNNIEISGLNFQNLTKSGTAGIVRINFTLSRLNPNGRNEYDYSQTFTSSAEIGW